MLELEGTTLGHYQLQSHLARGGMSEVYIAYDQIRQRTVAVKVISHDQDNYIEHFQREMKVLGTLTHPHILPTLDYGEHDDCHYFVMPYMEKGTLRACIKYSLFTSEEAGSILEQVASALQCAHEHGIIHRDIKPSNMLMDTDMHVYLADFGLAKEIEDDSDFTQTGDLIGTPEYMAPELAEEPANVRSDIYALGIVLYQMLTGQVPFKGKTPLAICWKHMQEQPLPPSFLNPAISPQIEQVVLQALEKDPQQRFESAQAMAWAYKRALQTSAQAGILQMVASQTVSTTSLALPVQRVIVWPGHTRKQRHPAFLTLVAAFLLLVVPLSLGLSVYKDGLHPQLSTALGASVQFAHANGVLHEGPPHPSPISTPIVSNNVPITQTTEVRVIRHTSGQHNDPHHHKKGHHKNGDDVRQYVDQHVQGGKHRTDKRTFEKERWRYLHDL